MKIQDLDINEIIPYANNPRNNAAAIDAVAASIKEFGFKVPVVIDRNNILITGHTRLEAAKKLGITKIPAIRASDLTDAQVKAFRLADNKVAEIAEWDDKALAAELQALDDMDFDMSEFGFSDDELRDNVEGLEDPEIPEEPDPVTQPGDIFQLGRHRLMCGDSTNPEDITALCDGRAMDLLLTDPPYNGEYEGAFVNPEAREQLQNDKMTRNEYREFIMSAFAAANHALRPGAAIYIWFADKETISIYTGVEHTPGWTIRQQLVWVKQRLVFGRSDYQYQHEPCIYAVKSGAERFFTDARTETTVEDDRPDIRNLSKPELVMMCRELMDALTPGATTVLREDRPSRNEIHPTMKPVKLFARLMANSSRKGEAVLDIFGGSGTTIIAAEQLGRRAYAMELSPRYCDAILARYEAFTGIKPVKIGGRS